MITINQTVETTRTITATVSVDDIKAVAILAVRRQAGIADDAQVIASEADADGSGGFAVKIAVKEFAAAQVAVDAPATDQSAVAPSAPAEGGVPVTAAL